MTPVPVFQIDAFSSRLFGGNPAAVIPLEKWLDDSQLQAIAAENNLSETAFLCRTDTADYKLRWFTPTAEVELCGHATLASAWWLFHHGGAQQDTLRFSTRSGVLQATRRDDSVEIDLPMRPSAPDDSERKQISEALNQSPMELRRGANHIAVFDSAQTIRALQPDFTKLRALHPLGLIVTAPGENCDFVSRYFAPSYGVDEDPVTGSAHADLAPYWADRLQKNRLSAHQLSARGGELMVELRADRVLLTGQCVLYLRGEIFLS